MVSQVYYACKMVNSLFLQSHLKNKMLGIERWCCYLCFECVLMLMGADAATEAD